MKLFISFIVLFGAYILITSFSLWLFQPEGLVLKEMETGSGERISIPYTEKVREYTQRVFKTVISSDGTSLKYLSLSRLNVASFEVYLNGEEILKVGDENSFSNLWTMSFIVPLNLEDGENELSIRVRALYDIEIKGPIQILERVDWVKLGLSIAFLEGISIFTSGALFMMGIILLGLSLRLGVAFKTYAMFGASLFFAAVYSVDMWYVPPGMSESMFLVLKRLIYASASLSVGLYSTGVGILVNKKRWVRVSLAMSLAIASITSLIPSFHVARELHFLLSPLLIIIFLHALVFILKYFQEHFIFMASVFMSISIIHHSISALIPTNLPSILGIGELYFAFVFSMFLIKDVGKLQRRLREIELESMVDPLTGAYNRRALERLDYSERDSLVFFDLDGFKRLNDERGHEYGDLVLKRFVESVKSEIRSDDVIVRYGGDEFVLVLRNCDQKEARKISRRILTIFRRSTGVDASFGISKLEGGLDRALKIADSKMYRVKKQKHGSKE